MIGKVAIITLYSNRVPNYGNVYQNYACEQIYKNFGYVVESVVREKPFSALSLLKYHGFRIINAIFGFRLSSNQKLWKKIILFSKFKQKYLHIRYVKSGKLIDTNYDYYSIGSDQVWNPNWTYRSDDMRWYFCADIPMEKCICLSPSFGVNELPKDRKEEYSRFLNRFEWLSTREESGRDIIRDTTGKEAEVLIDPTLIISQTKWNQIQRKPEFLKKETKYIFCYFLGGISSDRKVAIKKYCTQNGLELYDMRDEKTRLFALGPSEFLWLLAHAEGVFTDSFHGSVFSIIYRKPLFVFRREGKNNYMFSRLETLLKKFNLKNRIIDNLNNLSRLEDCDYNEAYQLLKIEQEKLLIYLRKALNKMDNKGKV